MVLQKAVAHDEQGKRHQNSSGHFVMMSKGNRVNQERKWLRNQDESEWSLNTSLITFWSSISRARWPFLEANVPPVVRLSYSSRRTANDATSHDGSFDHWNVNQELVEEWKKAHDCSLSHSLRARRLKKTTDVHPIVRNGSGSQQWRGVQRRRQGTVRKYFINSTDTLGFWLN